MIRNLYLVKCDAEQTEIFATCAVHHSVFPFPLMSFDAHLLSGDILRWAYEIVGFIGQNGQMLPIWYDSCICACKFTLVFLTAIQCGRDTSSESRLLFFADYKKMKIQKSPKNFVTCTKVGLCVIIVMVFSAILDVMIIY